MKKTTLGLLGAALLPVTGWAAFQAGAIAGPKEERGIPFAVEFSLGVANGEATEHVYDYDTGSRRQLSRLDWDLKNVGLGGGRGSVRLMDRLTLNGGIWLALTEGSGEMDDTDWLDYGSSDWTHYSLSDVDVTEGYVLDANATWDLYRLDAATLKVLAGYKQNGWSWEDSGVYLLYPEYGYVPQDLDGDNMINYEQEFRMPYVGASAELALGSFTVSGYAIYSPIVAAEDWDHHVERTLKFHETFEDGEMLGFGGEVRYDFAMGSFKGLFLTAAVDFQAVDLIVGDMELEDYSTGETDSASDIAGIENEFMVISLGGGFRF